MPPIRAATRSSVIPRCLRIPPPTGIVDHRGGARALLESDPARHAVDDQPMSSGDVRASYLVNGSSRWLNAQAFCSIPEQVLLSNAPGQPPLSRWIAQIDRKFIL